MNVFHEQMAEQSLTELLDLSIQPGERCVVDLTALRDLLLCLINQINRLGAGRETADRRETADSGETADRSEADVGRHVDESQPLSLSISDTSKQLEYSEEAVSKSTSLMQDLLKETQELKEETNNLKKEVETLQNQFSQCVTLEDMQAALVIQRQNVLKELKDSITGTGISDTSREGTSLPPEALLDVAQLMEMQKSLEARAERLEGPGHWG